MLGGKPHGPISAPGSFAPLVPTIVSVPLALLFSLGVQGDSSGYIVGLISLGLLTSLDLRRGVLRLFSGFAVSILASLYVIEHSAIGRGFSPLLYGDLSLLLISLPLSLGVLVAGLLFSHSSKYKIIETNVLASVTLAVGLGMGSAMKASVNPSPDSTIFAVLYFIALSFPANIVQMFLLHLLDKLWNVRNVSLAMMPTAFFAYNLLNFLGYAASQNLNQLYPFLSSLGFLPAVALAGVGFPTLVKKTTGALSTVAKGITGPTITVTVTPLARQSRDQTIKIATESGGKPKNMAKIVATITKPGGNKEPLKLSRVSAGEYKAFYRPKALGNYTVRVAATSDENSTTDKSFSFTLQPPPMTPLPPPPTKHPPQSLAPQLPPPRPQFPSSTSQQSSSLASTSLPRLDSWDPRVWVNQDIHGYKIKEHLATGLTGYVLRASFEHGGTEMAIKIPILKTTTGATALGETMSEATRLLELSGQSKYVVQLRGILVDRLNVQEILKGDTALYLHSPPAIIMELMKGGAAKSLVEDPAYDSLFYSEKWAGIVMLVGYMIATALETIHNAGFVHLDVKPQNILFNVKPPPTGREVIEQIQSGALVPKLADLGSAIRVGGKVTEFTSEYAPGEQVLGEIAAPAMDIYALGATMYNMLTKTPVNSKKLIDTMNSVTQNPGSDRVTNDLRSAWKAFEPDFTKIGKFQSAIPVMKKMLAKDPRDRPAAGAVASSLRGLGDMKISS